MKLRFIKAGTIDKNIKCTIRKSGSLGFTRQAAEKLKLATKKSMMIAVNEEIEDDLNLYMCLNDSIEEGAYPIKKAGEYFYSKTRNLFDELNVNYKGNITIVYDIVEFEYEGEQMYKLLRRDIKKREK